ncbi:MAG TPA: hypothetical protein VLB86_01200 [Gaiellaceae bacterium]|nr:hypothetical protein [Gaiellaceae bacterium]
MRHRPPIAIRRALAVGLAGLAGLAYPGAARADAEEDLAARYAPVVRLVAQEEECGPGEPYRPSDIDAFLDDDTVSLRGPWRSNDLVTIAPSADDLGRGLFEYNLDFPGDALQPGCNYERWARLVTEGTEPTVYAHVASEAGRPDRLALQYWLYYPYNDWNNLHEGDWEMIQLVFAAGSAEDALDGRPLELGYSQHEGAERASWGDDKLEVVEGTHPVVYPAAGSHANFYDSSLFLGRSASEGVGCDDTTGPSVDVRPVVRTIPGDPAAARAAYPWIAFEGRWGERREAFYNGPTGPNLKTQWTEPITWAEDWRDVSYAIPAGGALGTGATDFFCGAVGAGSNLVLALVRNPPLVLGIVVALLALLLWIAARATWRPTAPRRLARRRSSGQAISATSRMYAARPLLFIGIGLVTIPISALVALLQTGITDASTILGVTPEGEGAGLRAGVAVGLGAVLTLLGLAIVQGATARAMAELDAGRDVGLVDAYRLALERIRPLLASLAVAVTVVGLLGLSVFLLPIAIVLVVRWALLVPCVELERQSALGALRRSGALVAHQWPKVVGLVVLAAAFVILVGPVLGGLLLLGTGLPYTYVNLVAGLVYALAMPLVGITTTYVYYDALVRERLQEESGAADELPAEAGL